MTLPVMQGLGGRRHLSRGVYLSRVFRFHGVLLTRNDMKVITKYACLPLTIFRKLHRKQGPVPYFHPCFGLVILNLGFHTNKNKNKNPNPNKQKNNLFLGELTLVGRNFYYSSLD